MKLWFTIYINAHIVICDYGFIDSTSILFNSAVTNHLVIVLLESILSMTIISVSKILVNSVLVLLNLR